MRPEIEKVLARLISSAAYFEDGDMVQETVEAVGQVEQYLEKGNDLECHHVSSMKRLADALEKAKNCLMDIMQDDGVVVLLQKTSDDRDEA